MKQPLTAAGREREGRRQKEESPGCGKAPRLAWPVGVFACRPERAFRGPYRQSEMSWAETYYL